MLLTVLFFVCMLLWLIFIWPGENRPAGICAWLAVLLLYFMDHGLRIPLH